MNRYEFNSDIQELKEIKVGMLFISASGHTARVIERLPRSEWYVEFTNPFESKINKQKMSKKILLKQLEECKKPNSTVRIFYD